MPRLNNFIPFSFPFSLITQRLAAQLLFVFIFFRSLFLHNAAMLLSSRWLNWLRPNRIVLYIRFMVHLVRNIISLVCALVHIFYAFLFYHFIIIFLFIRLIFASRRFSQIDSSYTDDYMCTYSQDFFCCCHCTLYKFTTWTLYARNTKDIAMNSLEIGKFNYLL